MVHREQNESLRITSQNDSQDVALYISRWIVCCKLIAWKQKFIAKVVVNISSFERRFRKEVRAVFH